MNCDQVFSALTRGPFPTGNVPLDERVERHLETCGSCRRLAAALQPAVELFEEAIAPEESSQLPAYWGDLFSQGEAATLPRTGVLSLSRLIRAAAPARRATGWGWEHAWRIAAALLLGMALGGVLRAALQDGSDAAPLAGQRDATRDAWQAPRGSRLAAFEGMRMTQACGPLAMLLGPDRAAAVEAARWDAAQPPANGTPVPPAETESGKDSSPAAWTNIVQQKCCTECHHAGDSGVSLTQAARVHVANSCALCHDSTTTATLAVPLGGD